MGNKIKQESAKKKYEGMVYASNNNGDVIVLEYQSAKEVVVKFINSGYTTTTEMNCVKQGTIKDITAPTLQGVGISGSGLKKGKDGKILKEYQTWRDMILRCYNEKLHKKHPTYIGCTTSENFNHYDYFKQWCSKQVGFGNEGFELDKDILVKGNKVYSEDTCCFVPREINSLFGNNKRNRGEYPIGVTYKEKDKLFCAVATTSKYSKHIGAFRTPEEAFQAYKQAKEAYIKEVANKWKDKIDQRVYEALINWEICYHD